MSTEEESIRDLRDDIERDNIEYASAVQRLRGLLPRTVDVSDFHRHLEEKHGPRATLSDGSYDGAS